MIVMSKQARVLLSKIQEYCPEVTYELCDIEWYAHSFVLSLLGSWWKAKKKIEGSMGNTHVWYLPEIGSEDYNSLVGYIIRLGGKIKQVDLDWSNNHRQVYYYLCANVLTCDFNLNELRAILDIGSEFNIQDVQQAADKTRGMGGGDSISYIVATLQRNKQTKDIKAQRVSEAINKSQRCLKKISSKRSSALDVALMKMSFLDTKETQEVARRMDAIKRLVKANK
jgi:hypothetical protein